MLVGLKTFRVMCFSGAIILTCGRFCDDAIVGMMQ